MRLLVLDNNRKPQDWGARELCRSLQAAAKPADALTITVRRPEQGDLPLAGFERWNAVVLSGSLTAAGDKNPWVVALIEWTRRWMDSKRPLLGVCFGHQVLARAVAGDLAVADGGPKEFGSIRVKRVGESRLLGALPDYFAAASAHRDSVVSVPPGWRRTAESKICSIQAMEHGSLPFFGVQFHPERKPGVESVIQRFFECAGA